MLRIINIASWVCGPMLGHTHVHVLVKLNHWLQPWVLMSFWRSRQNVGGSLSEHSEGFGHDGGLKRHAECRLPDQQLLVKLIEQFFAFLSLTLYNYFNCYCWILAVSHWQSKLFNISALITFLMFEIKIVGSCLLIMFSLCRLYTHDNFGILTKEAIVEFCCGELICDLLGRSHLGISISSSS